MKSQTLKSIIAIALAALFGALTAFGVINTDQQATLEQCAEHIVNDFAPDAGPTDQD